MGWCTAGGVGSGGLGGRAVRMAATFPHKPAQYAAAHGAAGPVGGQMGVAGGIRGAGVTRGAKVGVGVGVTKLVQIGLFIVMTLQVGLQIVASKRDQAGPNPIQM